ncbi:tetratricopeptide repeat protein [Nitrospina watsonii]|uniref:Tetratricopeptide repeat protein n=1 Tax=Nitrospina watsonii TaxID=1323948 RepID=A0ABM9HGI1_9BACT|nr:hypothetical protein [Nitrospina watsonii]CAI2719356.1 conserved membrane protein of unknown function [Nitrospina watsonii]
MGVRLVRGCRWWWIALWLWMHAGGGPAWAQPEELDPAQAAQQCRDGATIYCLALGMEAERQGQREQALDFFRLACVGHATSGHLRACTPLLALSLQMDRLEDEARHLEARCDGGHQETCFYLGKEYLKIGELNRATDLLLPLCRQGHAPSDPSDYGACYHMARGFERFRHYERAQELFDLDCDRNPDKAWASCEALLRMAYVRKETEKVAWSQVQGFQSAEIAFGVLAAIPLVGTWLWYRQRPWAWRCLRVGPVIAGICLVLWELAPKAGDLPPTDHIVSVMSFLSVVGLAALAHQKLQDRQEDADTADKPPRRPPPV